MQVRLLALLFGGLIIIIISTITIIIASGSVMCF